MKLTLLVPVYNEARTVAAVIARLRQLPVEKEIVVINDGSTDGTRELLDSLTGPGLQIIHQDPNQGKGAAIRAGLRAARGDVVIIQDADLELNPDEIPRLMGPIRAGTADVVYGSRFHAEMGKVRWVTHFANWFLAEVTNLLYGTRITDMETGYKMFRADIIPRLRLTANRFDIEPEFTAQFILLGCRMVELPISYQPRTYEMGKKIHWSDGFKAIATLLRYRFNTRWLTEGQPLI